jgi:hypothetical protein
MLMDQILENYYKQTKGGSYIIDMRCGNIILVDPDPKHLVTGKKIIPRIMLVNNTNTGDLI